MIQEIPLIYTTKGNIPVVDLVMETEWQETDENTVFIERYLLDGEIVKQSIHVRAKRSIFGTGQVGQIGG